MRYGNTHIPHQISETCAISLIKTHLVHGSLLGKSQVLYMLESSSRILHGHSLSHYWECRISNQIPWTVWSVWLRNMFLVLNYFVTSRITSGRGNRICPVCMCVSSLAEHVVRCVGTVHVLSWLGINLAQWMIVLTGQRSLRVKYYKWQGARGASMLGCPHWLICLLGPKFFKIAQTAFSNL